MHNVRLANLLLLTANLFDMLLPRHLSLVSVEQCYSLVQGYSTRYVARSSQADCIEFEAKWVYIQL